MEAAAPQLPQSLIVPSEQASFNPAAFSEYNLLSVDWTKEIVTFSHERTLRMELVPKRLFGSWLPLLVSTAAFAKAPTPYGYDCAYD